MNAFYDLKDMLCGELNDIVKKGELSAGDLDVVDKLTHSIKSLVTIMAMEEGGYSNEGGYSGRRDSMGRYASDGVSYARYNDGVSYARYNDGGYSGRRYSRDEGRSYMSNKLERMMEEASSEEERQVLQQAMARLKNM